MASYSIIDLSNGSFKTYDDGIAPEEKIFWVPYTDTDAPELGKWDRFKLKIKSQKVDYNIVITLGYDNGNGNTRFGNLQDTITIYNWGSKDKTDFTEGGMYGVEVEYDETDQAYILDLTGAYDGKGHHYTDGLYVNGKGFMDPGILVSEGLACELVYLAYTEAPTSIPECNPVEK